MSLYIGFTAEAEKKRSEGINQTVACAESIFAMCSQQSLEIDQRDVPVGDPADLAEAALAVEAAGAGRGVIGVEADRAATPLPADAPDFLDAEPADALPLQLRGDRHVDQAGLAAPVAITARDEHAGRAQIEEDAAFRGSRRPVPLAVARRQFRGDR